MMLFGYFTGQLMDNYSVMSQLNVYKASAGSGKTFRLAIEYIKLALTNETNYRHILAVTFTNKATAEMKSRIIGELYRLSRGHASGYMEVLSSELGWQPAMVEQQAKLALKRILHDYSRFSISTIDSFFQRVIKAFNRELGINSAYNVELDQQSILEEAVDRMIQSVDKDPKLLNWLNAFATDKIRDGEGWNLKKDILRLGNEIYNETFKSLDDSFYEKLNNRTFIQDYRKKLGKLIAHYEIRLRTIGQDGLNILHQEKLTVDDFKGKNKGPASAFGKLAELKFALNPTMQKALEDPSNWVTASVKEPLKTRLLEIAEKKLMPGLQQAIEFIEKEERKYITAKLIVNQLYTLGILVDLRKWVMELCHEKGIVLISDSGHLLKEVIADSETPFVYEKTGAVYSHFMIDEFQDTSGLQWNNFKPLIGNSLSENNLGMVVGDVKQAIYRWRSGDWRLLAGKLDESFPAFGIKNEVLSSNWRSHGKIIRFNNTVFSLIPEMLQRHIDSELLEAGVKTNPVSLTVQEVYAGSVQEISNRKVADLGYVRARFLESKNDLKDEKQQIIFDELVGSVKELQDNGVRANEIAILVRKKTDAALISDLFLEQKRNPENSAYNFEILSGESLFIINSDVINLVIALLNCFLNPDDEVVRAQLNHVYFQKVYPRLSEIGKIPDFSDKESADSGKTKNLQLDLFASTNQLHYEPPLGRQFELLHDPENSFLGFVGSKAFQELVSGKPILEIVYGICEKFNLFAIADELAYIQAFVDQISLFERNHASELTSFLNWWEENGDRFTIPVSESVDAINVLTIHKSKGLEFEYVFIPFFDWGIHPSTLPDQAPLLWCMPEIEPFSEMELVPVRYKKDLGKSIFYREYFIEKFNTYIDNLNLMYVAFTRAKAGLLIWSGYTGKMNNIGDLLKLAIENQSRTGSFGIPETQLLRFEADFEPGELLYESGSIPDIHQSEQAASTVLNVRLDSFGFADFRKFLTIRKRGEDFFTQDNKQQTGINKGKLIHEILSLVETENDLGKAVKRIETDGKISSADAAGLTAELRNLLHDQEIKHWFDGTFRVINERNILTGKNGIKRPDRIMISGDRVIVVDYKSGEYELDKYKSQLRTYVRELQNCGYTNVSGYIWYTKTNKRVEV